MTAAVKLLAALRAIHVVGPVVPECGICENVRTLCGGGEPLRLLDDLIRAWPARHPGDPSYPVGGDVEYFAVDDLWKNPRRLELLAWLIDQLEETSHA